MGQEQTQTDQNDGSTATFDDVLAAQNSLLKAVVIEQQEIVSLREQVLIHDIAFKGVIIAVLIFRLVKWIRK